MIMKQIETSIIIILLFKSLTAIKYGNLTVEPSARQLLDFKLSHKDPVGLWTTLSGEPVEIRNLVTVNSDLFSNQLHIDTNLHFDAERIPERVVHAKGTAAFGYFEVTNDISKYTNANVFNGIGKKTSVTVRFSTSTQSLGGLDVVAELKGMAVKFYTQQGNLDLLCLQTPVYLYRDPLYFSPVNHAFKRNPKTGLFDFTAIWDIMTQLPTTLHIFLWTRSDYGFPNGYRRMDSFPIHTYELNNNKGEKYYVRFSFRTQQGLANLTAEEAATADLDYYNRDLYNAIASKNYPSWILEMDVMSSEDIKHVDYNPFDVTRLWKNGTYFTVTIGSLVLNKNPDNMFRVVQQSAFNPGHLVPGIPGPVDTLFKGRRVFYRDTQNYRLGNNHNKILINLPHYAKTYARDGKPPVRDNMGETPNYFPNSFNGPAPYVDETLPKEKLLVLENRAVDLQSSWYFYNYVLTNEARRQRLVDSLADTLTSVTEPVLSRALEMLRLIDTDLGRRVTISLDVARAEANSNAS